MFKFLLNEDNLVFEAFTQILRSEASSFSGQQGS